MNQTPQNPAQPAVPRPQLKDQNSNYHLFVFPERTTLLVKSDIVAELVDGEAKNAQITYHDPAWLLYTFQPKGVSISFDPVLAFAASGELTEENTSFAAKAMICTVPSDEMISSYEYMLRDLNAARAGGVKPGAEAMTSNIGPGTTVTNIGGGRRVDPQ